MTLPARFAAAVLTAVATPPPRSRRRRRLTPRALIADVARLLQDRLIIGGTTFYHALPTCAR